jgi:hypothetical protein
MRRFSAIIAEIQKSRCIARFLFISIAGTETPQEPQLQRVTAKRKSACGAFASRSDDCQRALKLGSAATDGCNWEIGHCAR